MRKLSAEYAAHLTASELSHYMSLGLIETPTVEQINAHIGASLGELIEENERKEYRLQDAYGELQDAYGEIEELKRSISEVQERLDRVSPRKRLPGNGMMKVEGCRVLVY